jgi:hypothetical protein
MRYIYNWRKSMAYDDLKDADYAETRVKNPGKSKGRKGNTPPSTYKIPDLINEGEYVDTTVSNTNSGGPGSAGAAGWRAKYKSGSPAVQGEGPGPVKYQPPRDAGKMSISDLPGQETRAIPVPARKASK